MLLSGPKLTSAAVDQDWPFLYGTPYLWYDFSDLSTMWQDHARTIPVTSLDDPVLAVDDKSGNGNHSENQGAGYDPTYKPAMFGGHGGLDFGGSTDNISWPRTTIARTVIRVVRQTSYADFTPIFVGDGSGAYNFHRGTAGVMFHPSYAAAVVRNGRMVIDSTVYDPASSASLTDTDPHVISIVTTGNAVTSRFYDRNLARSFQEAGELVIYETALSTSDQDDANVQAGLKWS